MVPDVHAQSSACLANPSARLRETVSNGSCGAVTGLAFGDGGLLLSAGASGVFSGRVLGKQGAAPVHTAEVPCAVYGMAAHGGLAVTVGAEAAARLWEAHSGKAVAHHRRGRDTPAPRLRGM